ncbi:hypothetical protein [Microbacterium sp. p3-SID336]|uniref:hypothetical protein n=1 Tax=Microbacterium sp. p3-SID336 TaxID=2916212 RepID=UPI0021A43B3C|nr:hypothetical protein [Microbacterium sp. p3-SID336]MCT1476510.1 hypothetical protein [Microbacterium sp. p3-SID336]
MIWDSWTAGDWAGILGTIIAAFVGVGGLLIVLGVERSGRYVERVDASLAEVIAALGRRAAELDVYTSELFSLNDSHYQQVMVSQRRDARRASPGGPLDADLQAAAEVACLAATRRRDRAPVEALAAATFDLKQAVTLWQMERAGRIAADVRRWRTGELDSPAFIVRMQEHRDGARASGEAALAAENGG